MLKLLKYEMIGRIKLIAAVVLGILVVNVLITYKVSTGTVGREATDITLGFTFLAVFTAGIIAFFNGILNFKRDLYSETGYLIYTLPKKAYYIISSKLVAALIELGIYMLVGGGFLLSKIYQYEQQSITELCDFMKKYPLETFEMIILMVLGVAFTYLLAYFSLSLSRATFGNKKVGEFLAIVIFFVITYLLGKISVEVWNLINLERYVNDDNSQPIMVSFMLIYAALCAALTAGTHFVIEKKVDL